MTTCKRCKGGGYVAIKNGRSKRCPFCNPGRVPERADWRYRLLGAGVYVTLIAATILLS